MIMSFVFILLTLPREAMVLTEGIPGKGWTQSGEMNCAVMSACREWDSVLSRQGWKKTDYFQMKGRKYVSVWQKNSKRITVLIWEKEIGKSGFSWGETADGTKRK